MKKQLHWTKITVYGNSLRSNDTNDEDDADHVVT